jgi:hypothetical protein
MVTGLTMKIPDRMVVSANRVAAADEESATLTISSRRTEIKQFMAAWSAAGDGVVAWSRYTALDI